MAVSRLKLVLIVVCLIAIPLTFWLNHRDVGSVNNRLTKVESPCLKYGPKSKLCQESFEKAVLTITHPQACAIERKAGTLRAVRELAASIGVTFTEPCAGARLAQERKRGSERAASRQLQANPNLSKHLDNGGGGSGDMGSLSPGESGSHKSPIPAHNGSPPGKPPKGHKGRTPPPAPAPTQTPASPSPAPGNSGETPGAEHGAKTCVELAVSACAGADLGEVVNGAGELIHTTTCGVTAPLLCPKP